MDIVVTTNRWRSDPASRDLVEFLNKRANQLGLDDAVIYYDFPAYADYEASVWRPDLLIFSPVHGLISIRHFDASLFQRTTEGIQQLDIALGDFTSNLHSRLVKSRQLRASRTQTIVDLHSLILFPGNFELPEGLAEELESEICIGLKAVQDFLIANKSIELDDDKIAEIRSVVEGAKAISRSVPRPPSDEKRKPLASMLSRAEREIANFDQHQRKIALMDVGGPARIRGLAGSGKTIILAMKAAHLHLTNPDQQILFTFLTKSLRGTIKSLIARFYRQYSEQDPNWKKVHIRHGWGGRATPGVYSEACTRAGITAINFTQAQLKSGVRQSPFGYVCSQLLSSTVEIAPFYDHVLIDEGQDFPAEFYPLALALTKGEGDHRSIVWAYDELQDIMNVKIRPPSELFGRKADGSPEIDLDRSSSRIPPGATNDAVLSRSYRNQRDVLVSAHALGFGVYGTIVQMLESAEHWEDVGYNVLSGPLKQGKAVKIERPNENSPLNISDIKGFKLIDSRLCRDFGDEVEWVSKEILRFTNAGVEYDEILVISLDDRSAKDYFAKISELLAEQGIASNNIIADPYNEPPFRLSGKVTLSTVYRAKGNEAAVVFALGVDAINSKTRSGRNKLFTAFTRTKAWLRASGIGERAEDILNELQTAKEKSPLLEFVMPDLEEIETIQRGFSKKAAAAQTARRKYIESLRAAGLSENEIEDEIRSDYTSG